MASFLERLTAPPLVSDGATGTQLQPHMTGRCYEELCVTRPDVVRDLAAAYVGAGSGMVTTNSFGGSRLKLTAYGLADQVHELNVAAARLAREGSGVETVVAGSLGPTGRLLAPLGDLSAEEATECFAQQAFALAEGGADLILVETMMAMEEAVAAARGARQVGLPVACTMSFVLNRKTMFGVTPAMACVELQDEGVVAVGFNCGELTLDTALELVDEFARCTDLPIIAQPNAGLPELIGGRAVYKETPERMAAYAKRFVDAGAKVVGGCCGSTPDHIRAIGQALR